ncbi:MAG: terpene cyclase/mutase family protein [Planctomycetes bacterium]|nr:terpene cyclase/mutase family protein [Planctomycetota bacterium]
MRLILSAVLLAPLFTQDADIQKVIQQLGSSSFEEQGKAATILEGLGREALPDLETATKSGNAQIRDWAVKIKAKIEKRLVERKGAAGTPAKPAAPEPPKGPKLEAAPGWVSRLPLRAIGKDREKAVAAAGGAAPTEAAVQAALRWLARHQAPEGLWGTESFTKQCGSACGGPGARDFDIGATGLALLAFLGAGHTFQSSEEWPDLAEPGKSMKFGEGVDRGLRWLLSLQDREGCIGPRSVKYMYNHLLAALAVCEAYLMTGSPELKSAAEKATQFTVAAQNPGRGWRYNALCNDNDTSVTGWAVMSLMAAELAGIPFPKSAYQGAQSWLDEATEQNGYYQTGYNARSTGKVYVAGKNEGFDHHATMSAIGVFSRLVLQKRRGDPALAGVNLLLADLAEWKTNKTDFYYWYWSTMAVYQLEMPQSPSWKKWFDSAKNALVGTQRTTRDSCRFGSWDPDNERWWSEGGRVYTTAMGALILEAPYRYPVFVPPAKKK